MKKTAGLNSSEILAIIRDVRSGRPVANSQIGEAIKILESNSNIKDSVLEVYKQEYTNIISTLKERVIRGAERHYR